jgi:hypothetical protein
LYLAAGGILRTNDGLVGAGGYSGLTNRLQTYHRKSGNHYLLAYQVVTQHHRDHLVGIGEAATMGAKLFTPASNFEVIEEGVTDHELEDSDFVAVTSRMTISEGKDRVELYEVSTARPYAYLVVYVPTEKLIFIVDHMGSRFKQGPPDSGVDRFSLDTP